MLGDFVTLGSIAPEFDTATQVRDLLAEWKRNRGELLTRFDLDGDGEIDLREWELARAQARREVMKQRRDALVAAEAHVLRKPLTKRLFLISDLDPAVIARRYRLWAGFHASIFLGAAAAAAWFHQIGAFLTLARSEGVEAPLWCAARTERRCQRSPAAFVSRTSHRCIAASISCSSASSRALTRSISSALC